MAATRTPCDRSRPATPSRLLPRGPSPFQRVFCLEKIWTTSAPIFLPAPARCGRRRDGDVRPQRGLSGSRLLPLQPVALTAVFLAQRVVLRHRGPFLPSATPASPRRGTTSTSRRPARCPGSPDGQVRLGPRDEPLLPRHGEDGEQADDRDHDEQKLEVPRPDPLIASAPRLLHAEDALVLALPAGSLEAERAAQRPFPRPEIDGVRDTAERFHILVRSPIALHSSTRGHFDSPIPPRRG